MAGPPPSERDLSYVIYLWEASLASLFIYVFIKTFLNFQYVKEHQPIFLTTEALQKL